jgi:hypothetical protein
MSSSKKIDIAKKENRDTNIVQRLKEKEKKPIREEIIREDNRDNVMIKHHSQNNKIQKILDKDESEKSSNQKGDFEK